MIVIGHRSRSTKSVKALIHVITILDIPAHIWCSWALVSSCGKTFPARWASLTKSILLGCVIRGVANLTLILHRIRITRIWMSAVINIMVQLFGVSEVSVHSHERYDILSLGSESWRHGFIWPIGRWHLVIIRSPKWTSHFNDVVEPTNDQEYNYLRASPISLETLYYQARCSEWYDIWLTLIYLILKGIIII